MRRIFVSFFLFVVVVFFVISYIFFPAVNWVLKYYIQPNINGNGYYRNILKGSFYVIISNLEKLPKDRWAAYIDSLAPGFDYPVNLINLNEVEFTSDEQHCLEKNLIVVQDDGEMYYQKVDHSTLLALGPIFDLEGGYLWIEPLVLALALVFLGGLSLVWAYPFWKRLQHISVKAIAFGNGELNSRASISRHSSLAPLAGAFNRMADQVQQLITSQRELSNAVSHELRTPIARIRFSLEMLRTASGKQDCNRYTMEIKRDIDELDELINEALVYARLNGSMPAIHLESVCLSSWLKDLSGIALRGYNHLHFKIVSHLDRDIETVRLAPRFMGRALDNLIRNAATHASCRVMVTVDRENGDVIIHVDDDGPGIPEADRERIFDPFIRLDTSRNRELGGYGLGLSIVDRVAKWHGGRVVVSDSPIGGARFTVRFTAEGSAGRQET